MLVKHSTVCRNRLSKEQMQSLHAQPRPLLGAAALHTRGQVRPLAILAEDLLIESYSRGGMVQKQELQCHKGVWPQVPSETCGAF